MNNSKLKLLKVHKIWRATIKRSKFNPARALHKKHNLLSLFQQPLKEIKIGNYNNRKHRLEIWNKNKKL